MKYRPEIDGLRALAVVSVILFHAGFDSFRGGFVGVDIFFVISGYLITSILLNDIEKDRFSIVHFYERRACRIMPALFFMMLICLPFAWRWMLPDQLESFSASMFSTVTFLSNFYFMSEVDYFAPSSELQPLLHTWTLSIEEQYYLFFPPLLYWIIKRSFNKAFVTIAVLLLVSFLFSEWGWRNYPEHSFFFSFSRFWELFVGSVLAFTVTKYPLKANNWLAAVGLAGIVASIVVYTDALPFPSAYTLIPVICTALLILFATSGTIVANLLSFKVFVGVGLISYSAYLWHQPIFSFARLRSFDMLTPTDMSLLSVLSLVVAFFSWKYIEQPFRKPNVSKRKVFSLSALGICLMGSIGAVGYNQEGFQTRLSKTFEDLEKISTVEESYCHIEGRKAPEQLRKGEFCTIGQGETLYAMIGDSHAGALFSSVEKYMSHTHVSSVAVSGGFCAPLLNGFTYRKNCTAMMQAALEQVLSDKNIETVILVAEWANYTTGYRDNKSAKLLFDNDGHALTAAENIKVFERSFDKTVNALLAAKKQIIIVNPVPEFHQDAYLYVAQKILVGDAETISEASTSLPTISLKQYKDRNAEVFDVFSNYQGVITFVDVSDLFCDQTLCRQNGNTNMPLYSDTNHVNELGAKQIVSLIFDNKL